MTDRNLFQHARDLVAASLSQADLPLHGINRPSVRSEDLRLLVFPYGVALHRIGHAGLPPDPAGPRDEIFLEGVWALLDIARHLGRSIQLLERAIESSQGHMDRDTARREEGDSWTLEGDEAERSFTHLLDASILLDSVFSYAKILADYVGLTAPSILGANVATIQRRGLHTVIKAATKADAGTPFRSAFEGADLGLNILASKATKTSMQGIRNARHHGGAVNQLVWAGARHESETSYRWDLLIRVNGPKGEYSANAIDDLRKVFAGLFGLMDRIVRNATGLETAEGDYLRCGAVVFVGPTGLLDTLVPRIEPSQNSDQI